jgi:hypothetical protein
MIADRRPSVSEQVERREVAEIVTHILLTVERRARIVWAMRYLEGRSPHEVVSALGITHRQYARLFERANTAINRKLPAYLAGDWCPGHAARFARLAANRATPAEARTRASTSTPARAAAPRTRRSRGYTRAAHDLTEPAPHRCRDRPWVSWARVPRRPPAPATIVRAGAAPRVGIGAVSTGTARRTREAQDISHGPVALRGVRGQGRNPVCVNRRLAR